MAGLAMSVGGTRHARRRAGAPCAERLAQRGRLRRAREEPAGPTARARLLSSIGTSRHGNQPVAFISDETSTERPDVAAASFERQIQSPIARTAHRHHRLEPSRVSAGAPRFRDGVFHNSTPGAFVPSPQSARELACASSALSPAFFLRATSWLSAFRAALRLEAG